MEDNVQSYKDYIHENKRMIGSSLFVVGAASTCFSIWKRTRGTTDLGLSALENTPGIQGNPKFVARAWAMRAFGIATSIVGVTTIAGVYSIAYFMDVKTFPEFVVKTRNGLHERFPFLRSSHDPNLDDSDEFMREWNKDADKEYEETPFAENTGQVVKKVFGIGGFFK
ncbi:hypothetical protein BC833DRAFT_252553 [Globomyces pollinis-pini]|nr:hypothetical protein BC833DRAFT_252553 [Globomyces pollinis-pini]KAJ2999785.1 hypothetical protein HDV02_001808 [Globomyces sp. JEL0801]KAJ2999802.1 hypothetical protein HDV02_001825 [Globomyces sp. JEL0801]